SSIRLPFVKSSDAVTVTPDDVLWFAVADQILRLDPRTEQVEAAPIGQHTVGAMTADSAGRVWFSDEATQKLGLYDRRNHSVVEVWFDAGGNAWLPDRTSSGFFIAVPGAR